MPRSARARAAFARAGVEPAAPDPGDDRRGVRGQAGDRHVVEHGAALDQVDGLEGAADAQVEPLVRRPPGDVGAGEDDLARRRRHAAADDVEQGGLARAVRAAQPEQAALGQRERDVVQHAEAAVLLEDARTSSSVASAASPPPAPVAAPARCRPAMLAPALPAGAGRRRRPRPRPPGPRLPGPRPPVPRAASSARTAAAGPDFRAQPRDPGRTMPDSPSGSTSSTTVSSRPSTMRMLTLTQLLAPCRYWMTSAPMTAPMTERRPPMNSMISRASSVVGSTTVSGTNCWVPAYTAPPRAANTQPSTNSSSLRRGVRTPSAAAVRSSTPSTNSSRPMSEDRIRDGDEHHQPRAARRR